MDYFERCKKRIEEAKSVTSKARFRPTAGGLTEISGMEVEVDGNLDIIRRDEWKWFSEKMTYYVYYRSEKVPLNQSESEELYKQATSKEDELIKKHREDILKEL